MPIPGNRLLIAFYGDDFTGSTDALDFLEKAGIRTMLFIEPPSREEIDRYPGIQAIGITGITRALSPAAMEQALVPAFSALKMINPRHVHYKVCSTFDSSPQIGSIGKAIDLGAERFQPVFIPLLVGAPVLGRYCVFGNLFARMGIGSNGSIFRLDRHPSMSRHPVTPAGESDLRLHLERQTYLKTGLVDILDIQQGEEQTRDAIHRELSAGSGTILFDVLEQTQMPLIGKMIDSYATEAVPLFSVGSSAVEMALGSFWLQTGEITAPSAWPEIGHAGPLLVLSGSCSPVTDGQIAYGVSIGFLEIAIDTETVAREGLSEEIIQSYVSIVASALAAGQSVILHTSRGNQDERVSRTGQLFREMGLDPTGTSALYGTLLGNIALELAGLGVYKRIVIAGGDTSGYAARAMGIQALEMITTLSPGAPLCRAHAPGSPVNGLQVNFKGGQVGAENYFETVLNGQ